MEMDIIRASMNEVVFMIIVSPSPPPKRRGNEDIYVNTKFRERGRKVSVKPLI